MQEFWVASGTRHQLADEAAHAVEIGYAVFAFDPHLPDDEVRERFDAFLARVRTDRPIAIKRAGPGRPAGAISITGNHLRCWADHRILLLADLMLRDHDPGVERKTLAMWMFPEIDDGLKRGNKYDEARRHLEEALNHICVLNAQARKTTKL